MGGLFGGSKKTTTTVYSGLQIQTTSQSLPIPIVYGQNLVSPNCIWYTNFHSQKKKAKGGKGGGGGGKVGAGGGSAQETVYFADIIMGVCEGPINSIPTVYQTSATPVSVSGLDLSVALGTQGQAPWSYVVSSRPAEALGYSGLAYVYGVNFSLGASASLGSHNMVVLGLLAGTGFNLLDADPALVIKDFLTDPHHGTYFPEESVDLTTLVGTSGDSSLQTYAWAMGIALSPVLTNQETASSILDKWLKLLGVAAVWSEGKLRFIPYWTSPVTGNGRTWVPRLTVVADLGDDDFVDAGTDTDPVIVDRSNQYTAENRVSLEIVSRVRDYISGPVTVHDQAAMDRFGPIEGSSTSAHEVCDLSIGQVIAQIMLQRSLQIRNTYKFRLSWEHCLLDPMDLVNITDPGIGLVQHTVRIVSIEESEDGELDVTAEDFPEDLVSPVIYPQQPQSNGYPNILAPPSSVSTPVIIEPPSTLMSGGLEIWAAVSPAVGGIGNWGGCYIWSSFDGDSYAQIGQLSSASMMGVTTTSLAAYSGVNPDPQTVTVNVAQSAAQLGSTTPSNAEAGVNLAYIGGEFISFETATLTGANQYVLSGLYRRMDGAPSLAIPAGSPFVLLTGPLAKVTYPREWIGREVHLKFQSYNIFGAAVQDLSLCTEYLYTISGYDVSDPIIQAMTLGQSMDYGRVVDSPDLRSDWGNVTSLVKSIVDLGTVA